MASQDSRLVISEENDITRVSFVDRNILEEAVIQQIGDEIIAIIEQAAVPKVLVNFEAVEHLSSAALGMLITINNKVRQRGGQLRLCGINDQIYEIFTMTKLNKLFQIHKTAADTLPTFK